MRRSICRLLAVNDALDELRVRLQQAAHELRSGAQEPAEILTLIEDCARLAAEAAAQVDTNVRAAVEPLPDLPGQLLLAAAQT